MEKKGKRNGKLEAALFTKGEWVPSTLGRIGTVDEGAIDCGVWKGLTHLLDRCNGWLFLSGGVFGKILWCQRVAPTRNMSFFGMQVSAVGCTHAWVTAALEKVHVGILEQCFGCTIWVPQEHLNPPLITSAQEKQLL